jgi:hypothetical protein
MLAEFQRLFTLGDPQQIRVHRKMSDNCPRTTHANNKNR